MHLRKNAFQGLLESKSASFLGTLNTGVISEQMRSSQKGYLKKMAHFGQPYLINYLLLHHLDRKGTV